MSAALEAPFGRRGLRPLLHPRGSRQRLPQPLWTMDFVRHRTLSAGQGRPGLTISRNSQGWDPLRGVMVEAGEPRFTPQGLLIEGKRRNYLHDSASPVTQTRTLGAGTYTLWMEGSGSVTLSGGPTGVASAGNPVTFTLASEAGVTFTVAGSVTRFQCETNPDNTNDGRFGTSFIATPQDDGATRELDFVSSTDVSWFNPAEGTMLVEVYFETTPEDNGSNDVQRIATVSDGSSNNRLDINRNDTENDGAARLVVSAGGATIGLGDSVTLSKGRHTICAGYSSANSYFVVDRSIVSLTQNDPYDSLNDISIFSVGSLWVPNKALFGSVESISYWDRALPLSVAATI